MSETKKKTKKRVTPLSYGDSVMMGYHSRFILTRVAQDILSNLNGQMAGRGASPLKDKLSLLAGSVGKDTLIDYYHMIATNSGTLSRHGVPTLMSQLDKDARAYLHAVVQVQLATAYVRMWYGDAVNPYMERALETALWSAQRYAQQPGEKEPDWDDRYARIRFMRAPHPLCAEINSCMMSLVDAWCNRGSFLLALSLLENERRNFPDELMNELGHHYTSSIAWCEKSFTSRAIMAGDAGYALIKRYHQDVAVYDNIRYSDSEYLYYVDRMMPEKDTDKHPEPPLPRNVSRTDVTEGDNKLYAETVKRFRDSNPDRVKTRLVQKIYEKHRKTLADTHVLKDLETRLKTYQEEWEDED